MIFALAMFELRSDFYIVFAVRRFFEREHLYVTFQRIHTLPDEQNGDVDGQQEYHDRVHFPRLQRFLRSQTENDY